MPQLRKDPVTHEWVVIATERGKRPSDFSTANNEDVTQRIAHNEKCPFCKGNESMTPPEVLGYRDPGTQPNTPGWWVRVVSNKFPALAIEGELDRQGVGMYSFMNGVGAHEVIIETTEHNRCIATISTQQATEVFWAARQRIIDLSQDDRFKYVLLFRNHGKIAGASLEHPHSQLIALPMVPKDIMEEMRGVERFYEYHDRCVYCDMLRQEKNFGRRVVEENDSFVAFEPFAPKFPFETWVVPKSHKSSLIEEDPDQVAEFAQITQNVLRRIGKCLNYPPYNYMLHTAPVNMERDPHPYFHYHLEIMPRLTIAAGFEMGTGVYINVTSPEDAAEHLRAADISNELCAAAISGKAH